MGKFKSVMHRLLATRLAPREEKAALSPDAQSRHKATVFRDYVMDRELGDHTPPHRKALAPHLLKRRKERIAEAEKEYPDFPEAYHRVRNG